MWLLLQAHLLAAPGRCAVSHCVSACIFPAKKQIFLWGTNKRAAFCVFSWLHADEYIDRQGEIWPVFSPSWVFPSVLWCSCWLFGTPGWLERPRTPQSPSSTYVFPFSPRISNKLWKLFLSHWLGNMIILMWMIYHKVFKLSYAGKSRLAFNIRDSQRVFWVPFRSSRNLGSDSGTDTS